MIQVYPTGNTKKFGVAIVRESAANTVRKSIKRKLVVYAFSKAGARLYCIVRNTTGGGATWLLYPAVVTIGADKLRAPIDLPALANHPMASAA